MQLDMNALGARISQALADQGLSIREGARRSGLSLGRFADVLYGRTARPQPETLQAISKGLNISYRELALNAYGIVHDEVAVPA